MHQVKHTEIIPETFIELMGVVEKANFVHENNVLFRGTSNYLVPSIIQKRRLLGSEVKPIEDKLLSEFYFDSSFYFQFKNEVLKDWEIRIAAREHGLNSSLLDWSNSIDTALEFAIDNFELKKIEFTYLWIFIKSDIYQIEIKSTLDNHGAFNNLKNNTIINYNSYGGKCFQRRKLIQGGFFLFQPFNEIHIPLNQNIFFANKLICIKIQKSLVEQIRSNLTSKYKLDKQVCPIFSQFDIELDEKCNLLNTKF